MVVSGIRDLFKFGVDETEDTPAYCPVPGCAPRAEH